MFDQDAKAVTQQALDDIAADGVDMSQPLEMDFFVVVPSEEVGHQMAAKAELIGFETSVEEDEESGEWTCYCTKTLIPTLDTVFDIEEHLDDLAEPLGGFSDGFGAYGDEEEE